MPEVRVSPAFGGAAKSAAENTRAGATGSDAGEKSAAKGKGWLFGIAALAVVAAGVFFWSRPPGSTGATANNTSTEATLPLETFVVNLDGAGQRAYLRVGITLGLAHPLPRDRKEEAPIALVRDAVLSVLASAQPEQLLTLEGKEKLKGELLRVLQERAPGLAVENVYFTEFLVQM